MEAGGVHLVVPGDPTQTIYPPLSLSDVRITRLVDCVGSLAKIQEETLNQQFYLHQNKLDGFQSIHFTAENFLRRVGTKDGQSMALAITVLARTMLQKQEEGRGPRALHA